MTEIEYRAEEYAERHQLAELELRGLGAKYGYQRIYNAEKVAYERGATEQKKIDLVKAREVYRKELSEIISLFNRFGKDIHNIDGLGELISLEGSVNDFRKAIEE